MKLVIDLEQKAVNPNMPITDLLRTALIVAVKLDFNDYVKWIDNELNGYQEVADINIPKYRLIEGVVKYYNPYYGWQDVIWANQRQYDMFSHIPIYAPIAEIEDFANTENLITKDLPVNMQRQLARNTLGIVPKILVGNSKFLSILDAVKNNILNWALNLEKQGILGEDMMFDDNERRAAENVTINNYIGSVEHSNFQQGTTNYMSISCSDENITAIRELVVEIKKLLPEIEDEVSREEVNADIATIEQQLKSPNPKIGVIYELLTSMRNVIEGMGGSLLASIPTIAEGFRNILG